MTNYAIRGASAYYQPAGILARTGAIMTDAAWVFGLLAFYLTRRHDSSLPSVGETIIIALGLVVMVVLQLFLLSGTAGHRLWRIELLIATPTGPNPWSRILEAPQQLLSARALHREKNTTPRSLLTGATTCLATLLALWQLQYYFFTHPFLRPLEQLGFSTGASSSGESLDFYYATSTWPTEFEGTPVFYSVPYAKGPPTQFLEKIIARWDAPEIQVTIEGPKTPVGLDPWQAWFDCLTAPLFWTCADIREKVLSRHLNEIREAGFRLSELRYLAGETRGIYIRAAQLLEGVPNRFQERAVLITQNGTHQTLILDRPATPKGDRAHALFLATLAQTKLHDDLGPSRKKLAQALARPPGPSLADLQARQSRLIAYASVEPSRLTTYLDWADTTFLIWDLARAQKRNDWMAISRTNYPNILRYAEDVSPDPRDPRLKEIRDLWLDIKANAPVLNED